MALFFFLFKRSKLVRRYFLMMIIGLGTTCINLRATTQLMNGQYGGGIQDEFELIHSLQMEESSNNDNLMVQEKEKEVVMVEGKGKALTCILTAAYGNDETSLDIPLDVTKYHHEDVHFYFFTNSEASAIETPGWQKIIHDTPYKRRITQSRYPKFLAWKLPLIQQTCSTVFYMDASAKITTTINDVLTVAQSVLNSEQGLGQVKHYRSSITDEFNQIVMHAKDTAANARKSKEWLKQQSDYTESDITLYENRYFVYDPTSVNYQQVSNFFWDRYSLELDSWRDQPLWAYSLYHFNFEPLRIKGGMMVPDKKREHAGHIGYKEDGTYLSFNNRGRGGGGGKRKKRKRGGRQERGREPNGDNGWNVKDAATATIYSRNDVGGQGGDGGGQGYTEVFGPGYESMLKKLSSTSRKQMEAKRDQQYDYYYDYAKEEQGGNPTSTTSSGGGGGGSGYTEVFGPGYEAMMNKLSSSSREQMMNKKKSKEESNEVDPSSSSFGSKYETSVNKFSSSLKEQMMNRNQQNLSQNRQQARFQRNQRGKKRMRPKKPPQSKFKFIDPFQDDHDEEGNENKNTYKILCTAPSQQMVWGSYAIRCTDLKIWAGQCAKDVQIDLRSHEDIEWTKNRRKSPQLQQYDATVSVKELIGSRPEFGQVYIDMVDNYGISDKKVPSDYHVIVQNEIHAQEKFTTHEYHVVEHWYNSYPADMFSNEPLFSIPDITSATSTLKLATVWTNQHQACPKIPKLSGISYDCIDETYDIETWYSKVFKKEQRGIDGQSIESILQDRKLGPGRLYYELFWMYDVLVIPTKTAFEPKLRYGNVQRTVSQMRSGVPVLIEVKGSVMEEFMDMYNYTCAYIAEPEKVESAKEESSATATSTTKRRYWSLTEAVEAMKSADLRRKCQEEGLKISSDFSPNKIAKKQLKELGYQGDFASRCSSQ